MISLRETDNENDGDDDNDNNNFADAVKKKKILTLGFTQMDLVNRIQSYL